MTTIINLPERKPLADNESIGAAVERVDSVLDEKSRRYFRAIVLATCARFTLSGLKTS